MCTGLPLGNTINYKFIKIAVIINRLDNYHSPEDKRTIVQIGDTSAKFRIFNPF